MGGCRAGEAGVTPELAVPAALRLIAQNGPAATVAACLLLKAIFLTLHLLALRPPRCSGLERLALLHWSFDVWNVWCLAEFLRSGRLPWGLETCVLYHVLGYLVYSLVYLYLQNREWTARGEVPSRMSGTPDSELTVRLSEADDGEETGAAPVSSPVDPFFTPGRRATGEVLSEDVPDEDRAAEDGEDGGRQEPATGGGRDALCAIPEDAEGTGDGQDRGAMQRDGSPERSQPGASPADGRPYRKLDAAGELLRRSPAATDGGRCRDITQDVAAALKAGRQREGDTDGTGCCRHSPVKAERGGPTGAEVRPPAERGGEEEQDQRGSDGGQAARQDGDGGKARNGGHNGLNGDHDGVANGDRNGGHSGGPEKDQDGLQNGDHKEVKDGD